MSDFSIKTYYIPEDTVMPDGYEEGKTRLPLDCYKVEEWWENFINECAENHIVLDREDFEKAITHELDDAFRCTFKEDRRTHIGDPKYCTIEFETEEGYELFRFRFGLHGKT